MRAAARRGHNRAHGSCFGAEVRRRLGDGWNAHDLEALLVHFADDVTFRSPVAAQLVGGDGIIRGKEALRAYWSEGLRRIPDLRFEVVGTYVGVDCLVINYRNQKGGLVNEVLVFDGALVVEGYGAYLGDDANPAGATSG